MKNSAKTPKKIQSPDMSDTNITRPSQDKTADTNIFPEEVYFQIQFIIYQIIFDIIIKELKNKIEEK